MWHRQELSPFHQPTPWFLVGFTGHGTQAAALCLSVVPCAAVAKKSAEPAAADVAAQEAAVEMVAKGVLNLGGEVWDGMEGLVHW